MGGADVAACVGRAGVRGLIGCRVVCWSDLVRADRMADDFKFLEEISEEKFLEFMNGVFVVVLVACMVELCICKMCDLVVNSILSRFV